MKITRFEPAAASPAQSFSALVSGRGFRKDTTIKLVYQALELIAAQAVITAASIQCVFNPVGSEQGEWDLKVIDTDGIEAGLKQALAWATPAVSPTIEITNNELLLYPNPARDQIRIALQSPAPGKAVISFYNPAGERVLKMEESIASGTHIIWADVSALSPGVYFCRAELGASSGSSGHVRKIKKLGIVK